MQTPLYTGRVPNLLLLSLFVFYRDIQRFTD